MSVRNSIKILRTATFNITPTKLLRSPDILTQTILVQTCRKYSSDTKRPCKELERVDCEGHVSKPVCPPCPCKERPPCRMRHVKRYMLNVKCCPPRVGCRPPCKVRRNCVVLNCQNRTSRQTKLFTCFPGDKLNRRCYHTDCSEANSAKMRVARRQAGERAAQQCHYEMEVKLAECHKIITSPGCADAVCVEQCKQLLKQQCVECNFNSEECSRYRNRCVSTPANPICDSCYQIKTVSNQQYVLNPGLCDGKPTLGCCGPDRIPPPPVRVGLKENQNYDKCKIPQGHIDPCAHKPPVVVTIERPKQGPEQCVNVCNTCVNMCKHVCNMTIPNCNQNGGNQLSNQCTYDPDCRPGQLPDSSTGDKCSWCRENCPQTQSTQCQNVNTTNPSAVDTCNWCQQNCGQNPAKPICDHCSDCQQTKPNPGICNPPVCQGKPATNPSAVDTCNWCQQNCDQNPAKPICGPCSDNQQSKPNPGICNPPVCQGKPATNPSAVDTCNWCQQNCDQNPSKPICGPCADNQETKPNPGICNPPVCQGKPATNPSAVDTCNWCQQNCDQNLSKPICGPCADNQETKPNPGICNPPVCPGKPATNPSAVDICNWCQQNCDQNPAKPICGPSSDNQETKPNPGICNPPVCPGKPGTNPSAVDTCNWCQQNCDQNPSKPICGPCADNQETKPNPGICNQPVCPGKPATNPSAVDTCNWCQQNCDQNPAKPICGPCSNNQETKPNPGICNPPVCPGKPATNPSTVDTCNWCQQNCDQNPAKPICGPCSDNQQTKPNPGICNPPVCTGKPATNPSAEDTCNWCQQNCDQNPAIPICGPCSDSQQTKPNPGICNPPVCQGKPTTNPSTVDTCNWCQQNCEQNLATPICGPCSDNQETKPNPGIGNTPVCPGKPTTNPSAVDTCNWCQQNCGQNPAKPICGPCSDNQETKPNPGIGNTPVCAGKPATNPSAEDTCNWCQQNCGQNPAKPICGPCSDNQETKPNPGIGNTPVGVGKPATNPSAEDTCNWCQQNCGQNPAKPICGPCSDNQQSKPNPGICSIISTVINSYKQVTCPKTCKLTCGPCQDPNLNPGDKEWCLKLPPRVPCDETACCKEPTFCEKIKRRHECNMVDPKDVPPSNQENECPCPSSSNNPCMQPNQVPCSTSKRKFHTSSLHLNPDKLKDGEKKLQEVLTKASVLISQKTDKPREFTGKIRIGMPATNCKNVEKLRIDMEFHNDLFTFKNDLKNKPEGLSNPVHNNEVPSSCSTTKKSKSSPNTSVKQADNTKSAKPECKTGKMCPKWTVSRYPPNPCSEKGKQSANPSDTTKTAKKPEATNSPCKPRSCSAPQDLPKCVKMPRTGSCTGKPCPPKATKPEVKKSRSIESIKKLYEELKKVNEKIKSMDKSSIHNHMKKPIDSAKPQPCKSTKKEPSAKYPSENLRAPKENSKPKIPGCDKLQSNLKASKSDTCTSKKSTNKSAMDSWKEMKCPKKSTLPKIPPTSSCPSKQDIKEIVSKPGFRTLASNTKSTTKSTENKPKSKTGCTPSSGNSKPKNLKFSTSSFLDYIRFPRINTYDEVENHFYVDKGVSISEINKTQEMQVIYERNMMNIKNYDKYNRLEFFVTRPRNELIRYISAKLRKFFSN